MARFGRYKIGLRKGVSLNKFIAILLAAVISMYVGGQIIEEFGDALQGTASPFYNGMSLLGWTVTTVTNATSTSSCAQDDGGGNTVQNCLTATNTGGVLTVVGIVVLAFLIKKVVHIRK